ncbi:MAG: hypothetical protein AAFV62_12900 [Pseudomonadota bacterium]
MIRQTTRVQNTRVYGHAISAPRLTWTGLALAGWYLALPTLALLLLFDVVVWTIGKVFFNACVAVWCLF